MSVPGDEGRPGGKGPNRRFAFDIGGTFTDLVIAAPDGQLAVGKRLTDPEAITRSVVEGLEGVLNREGISPGSIREVVSGATTLVTNLIIEGKGARSGLITTLGFGDILEIRREIRYDVYDLSAGFPDPLVPKGLRREVRERVDAEGRVLVPADPGEIRRAVEELVMEGIESLAVCFLHSYRNAGHERLVRDIAKSVAPRLFVSLSSDVLPEIREYERTTATVLNAYVRPFIGRYFGELEQALRQKGVEATLHIMQSNGGVISQEFAEEFPLWMLESGPAAGALAAAHVGRLAGVENIVSFDMGGTTAKACLISSGQPDTTTEFETARVHRFKKGSGFPVKLPVIDLIEIGAGGGSIAHIDSTGLLKVGPVSAGAKPGPACYGLGGDSPTVTDADLLLGYLDPTYFLGGEMALLQDHASSAMQGIADHLRLRPIEAASGIYRIVSENMAAAIKIHSAEKGKDIRDYSLLAFGGAGPVHAREVAKRIGIKRVIVPLNAGVLSAIGLLAAPIKVDIVRTFFVRLSEIKWPEVEQLFAEMRESAFRVLTKIGISEGRIQVKRSADMRYVGQGYEVRTPLPAIPFRDTVTPRVIDAFYRTYAEHFGQHLENVPVEALSWRLTAVSQIPMKLPSLSRSSQSGDREKGKRQCYFPERKRFHQARVYDHNSLHPGTRITGPAIIEQRESTAVVGPGDRVIVDRYGNLLIMVGD